MAYVGRFAPSPTGPLHLGSLIAAAASYLHARKAGGEWLVRIEDIDPPREAPGAAAEILSTLDAFGLHWDRSVLYQSSRLDAYRAVAEELVARGRAFRCSCSRRDVRETTGGSRRYPGTCRTRLTHPGATAIRVRVEPGTCTFVDGFQGPIDADVHATEGDYVIYRRDGLPAYHLAVVLDDAHQGVDTIVRGTDLLHSTGAHLHLQRLLDIPSPAYLHVPILVDRAGHKLSKQTGAPAVGTRYSAAIATRVLGYLGMPVPPEAAAANGAELWSWAIDRGDFSELFGRRRIHI